MGGFFEAYFSEESFEKSETAVCCPFNHQTPQGIPYKETNPSAHVNRENGVFHCKVCNRGLSETNFISQILGCDYNTAQRINDLFEVNKEQTIHDWIREVDRPPAVQEQALDLGISEQVLEDLQIKSRYGDDIAFPVFMYGVLMDVRSYRPNGKPKVCSVKGAMNGLVLPYDTWRDTPLERWTVLCAGEKDMAVARSNGLNAITITGGEQALPAVIESFRDRKIAIAYDNDETGQAGAKKIAGALYKIAKEVRVVTGFHEICKESGEDLTDFFTKYHKTKNHFAHYLQLTPPFTEKEAQAELEKIYPTVSLLEASQPRLTGRMVRSNLQVVATYEASYSAPSTIKGTKIGLAEDNKFNSMSLNEVRNWSLTENTMVDLLKLIDNNFNEKQLRDHTFDLLRIPRSERRVSIVRPTKETIFKCSVTDMFETNNKHTNTIEYTAYVIGHKLESGKKYKATHKLVPHPFKGNQLIMIITDVEAASDSVSKFEINDTNKELLSVIRDLPGTVEERIEQLTERVKGLLGYDGNNQLIQAFDLSFHTVLEFNFGHFERERGYLDTLIVGESRMGKSSTASTLCQTYQLGVFTSLAGNSATIPGLVGGSNKVNGSYQTRAGLIPQNHRGLVIFEELSKCQSNVIAELTDIRSSNEVRITRVSGTLNLPAMVRMITLSNVKSHNGEIRPIRSYPNGIEIVTELVGTAEDIARYDLMLVSGYDSDNPIDPFWTPQEPLPEEVYKARIRWVWSRDAKHVRIDDTVSRYIIEVSNTLNTEFKSHIKIFGTETWKKVCRLAIAVAGYLVSTDENFQDIIVKEEHVDYAVNFLVNAYDNDTFRLREYVQHQRKYNEIDDDGVTYLQDMYITHSALLLHLEENSRTQKQTLQAATGLSTDDFNRAVSSLVRGLFVTFNKNDIVPTERFRKGMRRINRLTVAQRIGEPRCNTSGHSTTSLNLKT